jgi:hypothetical protein
VDGEDRQGGGPFRWFVLIMLVAIVIILRTGSAEGLYALADFVHSLIRDLVPRG